MWESTLETGSRPQPFVHASSTGDRCSTDTDILIFTFAEEAEVCTLESKYSDTYEPRKADREVLSYASNKCRIKQGVRRRGRTASAVLASCPSL